MWVKQFGLMGKNKNFRGIPKNIKTRLASIESQEIKCGVVKTFSKSEIKLGKLKKFGLSYENGKLATEVSFLPSSSGRYSRRNKFGWVVIRKDLPMETKAFSMEVPNFGDWSKGSHDISYERQVYQRQRIEPSNLQFIIKVLDEDEENVVLSFEISEILNKTSDDFENKLLFQLNILQENFGDVDVVAKNEDFRQKISKELDWEVLPPGWWVDRERVNNFRKKLGDKAAKYFIERLKFLSGLNPIESYEGKNYLGNRSYYVFVFNKVIFAECPEFGNALYYLEGDDTLKWRDVFSNTKRKALELGAKRFLHHGNWKSKARALTMN